MEDGELSNLIKVCLSVFISLGYCFAINKIIPKGTKRLITVLPVICLYLWLPLNLRSVHFTGITGFFIAWLANFKLLLFAFGKGPLCSDPSISFGHFITIACLPIKIQQTPPSKQLRNHRQNKIEPETPIRPIPQRSNFDHPNEKKSQIDANPSQQMPYSNGKSKKNNTPPINSSTGYGSIILYAVKGLLLALIVSSYRYSEHIHPKLLFILYCLHIYLLLELILVTVAAMGRNLLGLELEPQFENPFLSTSLQDFWGKRWNLMVTRILRPTVYEPTLSAATRVVGRKWAPLPGVMATFVVSAAMHELILYYLGREPPTFRMTCFFLLHGLCLSVEIVLKRYINGRWRFPRLLSGLLAAGFVLSTTFWLFLPEFQRCKLEVKAFEECAHIAAYVKNLSFL